MADDRWVTVLEGTPADLEPFRQALGEEGIACVVTKAVAEGEAEAIAGLQVASADALVATAIVESLQTAPDRPVERDVGPPAAEPTGRTEVEYFARRVRWMSMLVAAWPVALWTTAFYLAACREHRTRSEKHALTLALLVVGGVLFAGLVVLILVDPVALRPAPDPGSPFPAPPPPLPPVFPGR